MVGGAGVTAIDKVIAVVEVNAIVVVKGIDGEISIDVVNTIGALIGVATVTEEIDWVEVASGINNVSVIPG